MKTQMAALTMKVKLQFVERSAQIPEQQNKKHGLYSVYGVLFICADINCEHGKATL